MIIYVIMNFKHLMIIIICNIVIPLQMKSNPHFYVDDNSYIKFRNFVTGIYNESDLDKHISYKLLEYAMTGYYLLKKKGKLNRENVLSIIDYTKPSTESRFFVVDIENKKILYKSLVSHGKNSGIFYARDFSNKMNTRKSSIGFFVTAHTYHGLYGYSLRLNGIEEKFNSNARKRKIVIHGGEYVSREYIKKHGIIGRSWGCPVIPEKLSANIINTIKNGSCLFVYYREEDYLNNSNYLKLNEAVEEFVKETDSISVSTR